MTVERSDHQCPGQQFSAGLDLLASSDRDLLTRLATAWSRHLCTANSRVLSSSEYPDELKDRARNLDAWMGSPRPAGDTPATTTAGDTSVADAAQAVTEIVAIATEVIGLDALDASRA